MGCRQDYHCGAVAVCMSGGYKDNEDMGETFVYTGAGGQEKQKQVGGSVPCAWMYFIYAVYDIYC